MGLDVGFYTQSGEELLSLRNHHDFFGIFLEEEPGTLEPSSDFDVCGSLLETVLCKIADEMTPEEPPSAAPEEPRSSTASEAFTGIPGAFFDAELEDWSAALLHYRTILLQLLEHVDEHGDLVCGWSS